MDQQQFTTLIQGCLRSDRRAQHDLFVACKPLVARIVYRLLGSRGKAEVEDTIQIAYIELFKSLLLYESKCAFETWVYRICTRVCMMNLRDKYRKRQITLVDVENAVDDAAIDSSHNPEGMLHQKELRKAIYSGLDELRAERKIVFMLHEIEGKNLEEISQILGCPKGTIKSRLFRARHDLEEKLSPYFHQPNKSEIVPEAVISFSILVIAAGLGWLDFPDTSTIMNRDFLAKKYSSTEMKIFNGTSGQPSWSAPILQ